MRIAFYRPQLKFRKHNGIEEGFRCNDIGRLEQRKGDYSDHLLDFSRSGGTARGA